MSLNREHANTGAVFNYDADPVFLHYDCAKKKIGNAAEEIGPVLAGTICEECDQPIIYIDPRKVNVILAALNPDGSSGKLGYVMGLDFTDKPPTVAAIELIGEALIGHAQVYGSRIPVFLAGSMLEGRASVMLLEFNGTTTPELKAWARGVLAYMGEI